MSDYEIGGYKIGSKSVYNSLFETKKTSTSKLKRIDKNNDGKISEDELVEFEETSSDSKNRKISTKVDGNGNIVSKTVVEGDGDDKTTTTTSYDANGKKTSRVTIQGKGDDRVTTAIKYKDGVKASSTSVSGKGKNRLLKYYTYDKKGRKTSGKTIKGTGDDKVVIDKTYKNGRKTKSVLTGMIDGNDVKITRNFDKSGNVIKQVTESDEGKSTIERGYDSNGRLQFEEETAMDGTYVSSTYSNYQTQNGKTTRTAEIVYEDEDGYERIVTEKQTLDSNGNVVSSTRTNSSRTNSTNSRTSRRSSSSSSLKDTILDNLEAILFYPPGYSRNSKNNSRTYTTEYNVPTETWYSKNKDKLNYKISTTSPTGNSSRYRNREFKPFKEILKGLATVFIADLIRKI